MKKILLFLLFIKSFLFCDFLMQYTKNTYFNSMCVKSFSYNSSSVNFTRSSDNTNFIIKNNQLIKPIKFLSGYVYSDGKCEINNLTTSSYETKPSKELNYQTLSVLGLSNQDLNFMFALSGTLCAFMFIFALYRWI